jgi:hypothetical protein
MLVQVLVDGVFGSQVLDPFGPDLACPFACYRLRAKGACRPATRLV